MIEHLDRRVLGAIEFVDSATMTRIETPLRVRADKLAIRRNRVALYVVHQAAGLDAHTASFAQPPAAPALESITYQIEVEDPGQRFVARLAEIKLPRKQATLTDPQSLLVPIQVPLSPASGAPLLATWAALRVRVQVAAPGTAEKTGLANVLVRLSVPAPARTQITLTDALGEALVIVSGIAPVLPAGPPAPDAPPDAIPAVLTTTFAASLEVLLDTAVVHPSPADLLAPRVLPRADPDAILRRHGAADPAVTARNPEAVELSSGKIERRVIDLAWP
jgi:hypothetical protein